MRSAKAVVLSRRWKKMRRMPALRMLDSCRDAACSAQFAADLLRRKGPPRLSNHRQRRLLCPRLQRPRRRAPKPRHELPPSHLRPPEICRLSASEAKNLTLRGLVLTGKLPLVLLLRRERRLVADWSSRLNNGGTMGAQANWNGRALSCTASSKWGSAPYR
jgi:hypothetical protein